MKLNFDATTVEPSTVSFDALPAGEYLAVITESVEKPTKAGTGSYLQLNLQVVDGPHKNRMLFDRLNLNNPNPTAVNIARETLSSICRAVGVMQPGDSAELHNRPMRVRVSVRNDPEYGTSNEIKGYMPASTTPLTQAPQAPAQQPAAGTLWGARG